MLAQEPDCAETVSSGAGYHAEFIFVAEALSSGGGTWPARRKRGAPRLGLCRVACLARLSRAPTLPSIDVDRHLGKTAASDWSG